MEFRVLGPLQVSRDGAEVPFEGGSARYSRCS